MDSESLKYLLDNPARITREQTAELEEILKEYPYFQAARAVHLKGLKEHDELKYNDALRRTAAYTTDRSILFDYITSEEFEQNAIARQIREQEERLKEITVYEFEEVHGRRSLEMDEAIQMKNAESEMVMDPDLFEPSRKSEVNIPSAESPETSEENLNLGSPLKFDASESHSFSEWLKLTSAKPIERNEERQNNENKERRLRKFELIEEFIAKNPKINPAKSYSRNNLAEQSLITPEALMTETLARVYLEQKNYEKAIQAYKILILKNPEKSGFFADQIRAIKKLQDSNKEQE